MHHLLHHSYHWNNESLIVDHCTAILSLSLSYSSILAFSFSLYLISSPHKIMGLNIPFNDGSKLTPNVCTWWLMLSHDLHLVQLTKYGEKTSLIETDIQYCSHCELVCIIWWEFETSRRLEKARQRSESPTGCSRRSHSLHASLSTPVRCHRHALL